MARLYPFRALRPKPEVAAQVAAVPYDVVTVDEARALADGNPLSFLRVSRPEIELPAGTDPYSDAVYERAAKNFATLKASVVRRRGRAERVFLPAPDGRSHPDRACRLLLDRRVRPRRDQETREDASRQGRRSDAAHEDARRADGSGVPHLPRVGGCRRDRRSRDRRRAALRFRRPWTACVTRSGG